MFLPYLRRREWIVFLPYLRRREWIVFLPYLHRREKECALVDEILELDNSIENSLYNRNKIGFVWRIKMFNEMGIYWSIYNGPMNSFLNAPFLTLKGKTTFQFWLQILLAKNRIF